MNLTRGSIIRGPGSVTLGTTVMHDKAGISAAFEQATFPVETSSWGRVDTIRGGRTAKVSWTPARQANANILAALFPRQTSTASSARK